MSKICILNYGSGNVQSVFNIISVLTEDVVISNSPEDINQASHLILPGVGAFGAAMEKINKTIPLEVLTVNVFEKKKPFLGICVGMQVLATTGFEFGEYAGLNWIPGIVEKMDSQDLSLPHVGWNNVSFKQASPLSQHFSDDPDFYFVHSFVLKPEHSADQLAVTEYGTPFCAAIQHQNIYGVQFHPEKSQEAGRILLTNFLSI